MQKSAAEGVQGLLGCTKLVHAGHIISCLLRTRQRIRDRIGKLAAISQPCIKLNTWPSTPEAVACFFFLSAIRNTTWRSFLHPSYGFRMFSADESHAPTAPSFRYTETSLEGRSRNLLIRAHRCLSPSLKARSSSLLGC